MEKFNVENFNAEEVLREVEEKVKKPNILICGATGVGKAVWSTICLELQRQKLDKMQSHRQKVCTYILHSNLV